MKLNKFLKWTLILFFALNLYSFLPLVTFYIKKDGDVIYRNADVADKLKGNKDPYFSFIVTSDTGSGMFLHEAATLKCIAFMNREDRFRKTPIDFVANVGDVTYRGKEWQYKIYIKLKKLIKYPVIDAIGNHDDDLDNGERGMALFNSYCGKEEFVFADRNAFFIVLDNRNGDFTDKQFSRFEDKLKLAKDYKHIFVLVHKPPFNPFQESWYRVETNPWSQRFLKLCDKYGVRMVFSGHESGFKEARIGSVTYLVSGGGGTILIQPSWEGGSLNYIVVKVNGDYVDYEIRKVQPPVWEYFSFYMWKDLMYFVRDVFL